jgi:DNA gyrase/topoisomerase IV subunit A
MGRSTVGTRGIALGNGEKVVGMIVIRGDGKPQSKRTVERVTTIDEVETSTLFEELDTDAMDDGNYLLCIGEKGVGKCTLMSEFGVQRRAGKGVTCFNINNKTGVLIHAMGVRDDQDIVMVSGAGVSNRIHVADIRVTGRAASGTHLMNLDKTDRLVDVAKVVRAEAEEKISE